MNFGLDVPHYVGRFDYYSVYLIESYFVRTHSKNIALRRLSAVAAESLLLSAVLAAIISLVMSVQKYAILLPAGIVGRC